jgi:NitT/TauT family transport system substrate-binding protein
VNTKIKFGISIVIIIAIIITSQSDNHGLFSIGSNTSVKTDNDNSKLKILKLGYFPNVNHAQAIIGLKNVDFQKFMESNQRDTIQGKIKIN